MANKGDGMDEEAIETRAESGEYLYGVEQERRVVAEDGEGELSEFEEAGFRC